MRTAIVAPSSHHARGLRQIGLARGRGDPGLVIRTDIPQAVRLEEREGRITFGRWRRKKSMFIGTWASAKSPSARCASRNGGSVASP
jgi:hypothetical protein